MRNHITGVGVLYLPQAREGNTYTSTFAFLSGRKALQWHRSKEYHIYAKNERRTQQDEL